MFAKIHGMRTLLNHKIESSWNSLRKAYKMHVKCDWNFQEPYELIGIVTGCSLIKNYPSKKSPNSIFQAPALPKKGLWLYTTECGAMCYQKYCGVTSNKLIDGFGDAYSPDK